MSVTINGAKKTSEPIALALTAGLVSTWASLSLPPHPGTTAESAAFATMAMNLMQRVHAGRCVAFQPASAGRAACVCRPVPTRRSLVARASSEDVGAAGTAAIAAGLVANPIVLWSAYTLKTTGAGLPPGPGGALGAAEGVSYLVILGIIGWSLYTKSSTGSGLPAGPSGLLGAVEGFSYLGLLAAILAFGANAAGL